eukprot:TRINITY_DN3346_c2_g1_i2.p4 TRINITY_DN3346_c2_g1~~TRINITY_DN3346_c2_g1_i2.p4  ORF type:complete len:121 (-),score=6.59 TRINITY_DN3346_c2_g1_i2:527-889(-)
MFILTKAFEIYKEQAFLNAACRAGDTIWERGLLKKGPGLCHGISGNGLALLNLYRVTRDSSWLIRASQFAEFIACDQFLQDSNTPDRPHSLFEGWAGACCLLSALADPVHLGFPYFEVIT